MAVLPPFRTLLRHSTKQIRYTYIAVSAILTPLLLYVLFMSAPRQSISPDVQHSLFSQRNVHALTTPVFHIPPLKPPKQNGCIIPKLNLNDSDITQFYQKMSPVSCGDGFDWVTLRQGRFSITPEAKRRYGDGIECTLTPLEFQTDFNTVEGSEVLTDVKDGSELKQDFYKVECTATTGEKYRNYQSGIHKKPEVVKRKSDKGVSSLDLDVIILGQDSLSYMAWLRHLPLTRKYLVEDLKAIEMEGQTVVGDGTPATIIPLLTGKREEDLPEARRGYSGARTVDNFPWIWNNYRDAGYVTSWQEDQPSVGTFHYRLLGFEKPPVDHYYRTYGVYAGPRFSEFPTDCIGATPRIVSENDYVTDLFDVYRGQGQRRWVFSFKSENSHNDNNHASKLDVHMRSHLQELQEKGHLDNAMLIVLADHGARFSKIRAFAQGKQEERMPYMAIRLPEKFRAKYPDIIKNLKINSQRLTTPFDLHETLHEVLHYTGSGRADISKRGVSLFKEIPIERDCKSADVDPHWCYCLDWSPVSARSSVILKAVGHVLTEINRMTDEHRDQCALLEVKTVQSAMEMKVKDDVLKFKDTADGGRGRFGKMDDSTKHSKIVYQITFVTTPGDGLFETTVTHDLKRNMFATSLKSISRINRYGSAPWCIMEKIPQMRPYCACKQPPPASFKAH